VESVEGKRSSVTGGGQIMPAEGGEAFSEWEQGVELVHGGKLKGGGGSVPLHRDRGRYGGGSGGQLGARQLKGRSPVWWCLARATGEPRSSGAAQSSGGSGAT
jgi:hypothetical protein